jgi:hypothetical protein
VGNSWGNGWFWLDDNLIIEGQITRVAGLSFNVSTVLFKNVIFCCYELLSWLFLQFFYFWLINNFQT